MVQLQGAKTKTVSGLVQVECGMGKWMDGLMDIMDEKVVGWLCPSRREERRGAVASGRRVFFVLAGRGGAEERQRADVV